MNYTIVAGTTTPLNFQLLEAGAPINLLGCTVTISINDRSGNPLNNPGTVLITDSMNGKVSLTPSSGLLFDPKNSPYGVRWVIVDAATHTSYCPTGPRDLWEILGA